MSFISDLIPQAWIKGLIIAAIAAVCGWGSKAVLEQEGRVIYTNEEMGIEIVVTQDITAQGTNMIKKLEQWLSERVNDI